MNKPHSAHSSSQDTVTASATKSSALLRVLLTFGGCVFAGGGGVLAFAVGRLFLGELVVEASAHDRVFFALLGVVAFCLLLLAINFIQAAVQYRTRNIVPGPTLYLLGATLVILAMFMGVSNAWMTAIVLAGTGFAIMSLEYRSEFI